MKRKWLRNSIISATMLTLALQPGMFNIIPHSNKVHAAESLLANKVVRLSPTSTLFIRDARLLMQEKGLLLAYTLTITNNGTTDLDLSDYWFRVKTKTGERFTSKVSDADKSITRVAPRSSVNITYTATVSSGTKLSDLQFEIAVIDFNVPGYERILGTVQYPQNASGITQIFQPSVMIMNNTKLKGAVKQYYTIDDQDGFYLTISFLLENVGYSSASLSNIGFAVQTESYSVYDVQADALSQLTVQPKERKIVTIQAKLPTAIAGKKLILVPYTMNNGSGEKLPHGQFEIPPVKPLSPAKSNTPRSVYINGQIVETVASQALIDESSGGKTVDIDFKLNNKGTEAIPLQDFQFLLRTENGINYPLTYARDHEDYLLPGIEQTFNVTGEVSSDIDVAKAQLIVKTAASEGREGYHVGVYAIQPSTQSGSVGGSFIYNSTYKIQLNAIHRTPLEDSDLLLAHLTITNTDNTAKSIPSSINGYFLVNGVKVTSDYKTVGLDRSINIAPNSSYQMAVYTKIPYTTVIDSIGFVLTDKVDENRTKNVYQFSGTSISEVPKINHQLEYTIDSIGSRAKAKLIETQIYSGESNQYFYAEVELVNNEARTSQMSELTGYLMDSQDRLVPVTFTKTDQRIASGGKLLVSAYAVAGKTFDIQDFEFVFGQSIRDTSGGENTGEKILVNPVSYRIKDADYQVKTNFTNLEFGAYTITLKNILATLNVSGLYDVNGVKLDLSYDLETDENYDAIAGEHQLVFEFVDQEPAKATYEKAFKINAGDDNQISLKNGRNIDLQIIYNDSEIQWKVNDYKTYKLNIYGLIDDTKILLASKELRWFTRE